MANNVSENPREQHPATPQFAGKRMRLGELCKPKQWKSLKQSDMTEAGYPVYGANGVIGFYHEYNHPDETILVGCRGTCGEISVCRPGRRSRRTLAEGRTEAMALKNPAKPSCSLSAFAPVQTMEAHGQGRSRNAEHERDKHDYIFPEPAEWGKHLLSRRHRNSEAQPYSMLDVFCCR